MFSQADGNFAFAMSLFLILGGGWMHEFYGSDRSIDIDGLDNDTEGPMTEGRMILGDAVEKVGIISVRDGHGDALFALID